MRGRSSRGYGTSQFALKTLKVSGDTLNEIRAPKLWMKPAPGMFDYHYEIAGLYYQPMINYCKEREDGGERRIIGLPDRTLANFDKRAYVVRPDYAYDYEKFLTKMYQRIAKTKNSKTIHCANELVSNSKKTTDLNIMRGADVFRNKYVCQIQLFYTGKIAKDEVLGDGIHRDRKASTEEASEKVEARAAEPELKKTVTNKSNNGRYGPSYEKSARLDSRRLYREDGLSLIGLSGAPELPRQDFAKVEEKVVREANERYAEYQKKKDINAQFLESTTEAKFLQVAAGLKLERADTNAPYKPLYFDTSYVKALADVQEKVRSKGKGDEIVIDDINLNFRRRRIEDIGHCERAVIHAEMYKETKVPDFNVGYDTVSRAATAYLR